MPNEQLKTPYRDGTRQIVLEPKARVNLTCFHGALTLNSRLRRPETNNCFRPEKFPIDIGFLSDRS
jgi:hypothetical protein